MDFKPAQCPSCGGSLQLPNDRSTVNCMYCGATIVVREAIQAAAAATVPNLLKLARAAAQSSNYTEAYDYFTRVLEADGNNAQAWVGKAEAAGRMSGQHSFRMPEMNTYFRNAVEVARPEEKASVQNNVANTLCRVVTDDYLKMFAGLSPKFWDGSTWNFFLGRVRQLIAVLEDATDYIPNNRAILQSLVWFYENNYRCIHYQSGFNGKRTRRDFDDRWNDWVRVKRAQYEEQLYALDPSLKPVRSDNTAVIVSRPVKRNIAFLVIGVVLLLGVVLIIFLLLLNDSKPPVRRETVEPAPSRSAQ